jgi:tetratricopeptide (TPR) repeat protein
MRITVASLTVLLSLLAALGCSRSPRYYVDRGNEFLGAHKYDDAAIQYRKALQKDPKFGDALYQLGLVATEQKQYFEAYTLFERAVDAEPGNDQARVKLAEVSLALYFLDPTKPKVFYDQIERASNQFLAKNPNSFDGLRLAGMVRLLDQKPKEAIEYFKKANQINPLQRDLTVAWVQALFLDKQPQEGERLALQLIRKEPAFGPIYEVLYRQYLTANRLPDAENLLKLKVSNSPTQADYLVELAQHYARMQKPSEMTSTLERLVSDPRTFPQGHLQVGDFYAKVGNWTEAVHQFEDGAKTDSKEKLLYQKRIVDALLMQHNRADAAQVVEAILKDHPKDIDARRVHASLSMESGKAEDLSRAIDEFTLLVKEAPNDAILRFNLGRSWQAKGDFDKARAEFKETVRLRNDYGPALNALIELCLRQQKPEEALRYSQQLLSYEPNNAKARLLGVASLIALQRYDEARSELTLLLKESPNNLDVQLQFGFLEIAEKKYKEAEVRFQKIYQAGQIDTRAAAGLVEVYSAQQQFERAIQVLNDDLKKSPDSTAVRGLLADTALRAGKYDVAIGAYLELLSREPKSAELYTRLGMVYQTKGEHSKAIAALQQAKRLAPEAPFPATLLGISLQKTQRTEEAKANYERALQLQPDSPTALNNLAFLLADSGSSDDALKLIQRALQRIPGQPTYTDTLGYIYLKKKMNDSAIQTFGKLVKAYPKSPVFRYHLGMALLEIGDAANARIELENALANQPSQEDELKVKELLSRL